MCHKQITAMLIGMVAASPLLAQQGSGMPQSYCTVEPIYHCAESMDNGSVVGHFGYRTSCTEADKSVEDVFIDIGDDNYFTPEPVDRGQPKIFLPGEHVDEFEVEFTATEIREGKEFSWTVRKIGIPVDFSKTKDLSLDCSRQPY